MTFQCWRQRWFDIEWQYVTADFIRVTTYKGMEVEFLQRGDLVGILHGKWNVIPLVSPVISPPGVRLEETPTNGTA